MKIAHASDLHGDYHILDRATEKPDVWVLTGDIFPNRTRGNVPNEVAFQQHWFSWKADSIVKRLRGAPVIIVPGNHDYADLAKLLRRSGVTAQEVTTEGLTFQGVRFAGFGHIPIIAGEWNRETGMDQLALLTRRALDLGKAEVLVTHCPPDGILNGNYEGNAPLTSHLAYRPHQVRLHLFGHAHEDGGKEETHMDVRFVNSACTVSIIDF
jgi:Icc-related predicted phosphoesterase